ncbi:MAG: hypothetical protein EBZ77_10100, partial [Chitinophagia bacterium]|nr:hypothetical protein [Chitinophagia bacterium]
MAGAQHYFNRVYTVHAYNSMIVGIVPKGSGYLTTCMVLDSSRGPNTAQDMMTLDSAGNVVYDSLVYNDTLIVYPGSNAFMRLPDGRFAMVPTNCKGFTGLRHIMPRFFDSTGKLLWDTTYNKMFCPEFAYWNIYDMKPLPWGGWLVLSNIACYDASIFTHNQNDICLTKLDEHFNVLWHRQIGHPKLNDEGRKLLIEPGVYTIGGLSNASSLYGAADIRNNFRCQIIQTDTDGNILHVWKSDTSKQSFCIRDLIRTRDGGYVYCGSGNGYKTLHFPDGTVADFYYKGWVAKLDSNFNMLWYDSVGLAYSLAPPEVTNVLELADGSIVVGGRLYGGTNGIDSVIDYDH